MQINKLSTALILCTVIWLSGCDTLSKIQNVWVNTITFTVDKDANNNSATAVDLVFIFKKELIEEVAKLNSHDYYSKVDQMVRDNPKLIQIVRWEFAPGQYKPDQKITKIQGTPMAAIVFASYSTPGDHRVTLGLQRDIDINLKANDFFISEHVK